MILKKQKRNLPKGITQRADGRYQATYSFHGTRYYFYDKDLTILMKKPHNKLYEIEHGIFCSPEKIRLNTWFETWMKEYKELYLKKGTIENYKRNYNIYIRPYIGTMYIKDTGFFIDTPKSLSSQCIIPLLPSICEMLKQLKIRQKKNMKKRKGNKKNYQ